CKDKIFRELFLHAMKIWKTEFMDLNFYDNNETEIENNSFLDNQYLLENDENSDIDLEAILDRELQN
ncbi:18656_t:CDS:2, partial [Gigaspora margarita]